MESLSYHDAAALLAWQVELGVDECIMDAPVNRYETPAAAPKPKVAPEAPQRGAVRFAETQVDVPALARAAAAQAGDIVALKAAIDSFGRCDLQKGARNLVFADGDPSARVMIVGDAPTRDEDRAGTPFVGPAGAMLDAMFAAIGMGRGTDVPVYMTLALPWRTPQDRAPSGEEIAMMAPFVERHIALADPDAVVIMGNVAAQALLGKPGITRMRGIWTEVCGKPAMPMFPPAHLLRNPLAKRDAWADLLDIQARLNP
ncbi:MULTISPECIES: uracil-DNA glycosylase [Roseobacteraceae]|uniref:Type-4 uracil-DNA glycosylase n=1 Tax=Pseudosulfitobacter pseudonitzschiae TaxID=1402135 RepID=A0A221K2Q0_9RHOB|nr:MULTISPECIES: uracil-DNA glycosylase [Roseobacteraceae]ASM73278.1 uracil DNA glycosylase superfamily protein [Pseudosulfitobacter pseudonitzschiae]